MKKYYKDEYCESIIAEAEEMLKSRKFDEKYIKELIGRQKGELSIKSKYYDGNIAEANWSLLEDDSKIEKLDEKMKDPRKVNALDVLHGLDEFPNREKDAEYEYVFIPSYYAVKMLILYYLDNPEKAKRIYSLRNAVVTRKGKKFYGGLPFILKYIGGDYEDKRVDLDKIVSGVLDTYSTNNTDNFLDDFIKDIIDCLNNFYKKDLILERRIYHFNHGKDNWFNIDFYEESKNLKLNYMLVNDYKILMHRDVKKDWQHLQKSDEKKARDKVSKTPYHPNNDSPKDSEALKGDMKGWFSQHINKKDRLVYRVEKNEKTVYIATVCDHYKDASNRSRTRVAYK